MNRLMTIGKIVILCLLVFTGGAYAEEAGCFQSSDNWIIRVYSGGSTSPYTFSIHVVDTNGDTVPAAGIEGLSAVTNPYVFETDANKPDVSLACDSQAGDAHILHDHLGGLTLTTIQNIVSIPTGSPVLGVSTNLINFGSVVLNVSKDSTLTVVNSGTAPLHISSVTSPTAPFSKITDGCNGATIAPAGICNIVIRFTPTSTGAFTRSFSVTSDGGNSTITLQGSGVSAGSGGR